MSMANIKHRSNLPEWFVPEKYAAAAEFKASDWVEQLEHRRQLLKGNPLYPVKIAGADHVTALEIWRTEVAAKVADMRISPLARFGNGSVFVVRGLGVTHRETGGFVTLPLGKAPLATAVFDDIFALYRSDRSGASGETAASRWDAIVSMATTGGAQPSMAEMDSKVEIGIDRAPLVKIDLKQSDPVLEDYFRKWLRDARRSQGVKAIRKSTPDYLSWHLLGVLPYIDLAIWGLETMGDPQPLGDKLFADILPEITGDYSKGENSLRGVSGTRTKAKELMMDLSALKVLAKAERDL